VDVRIGIQQAPREVAFESDASPQELADIVTEAWAANELVTLTDAKGRRILVPTDKIAFIEIGAEAIGRVGFGG
jgi:hypothetical protein